MCRLSTSFDGLICLTVSGCRLSTSSDCSMLGTFYGCRAFHAQKALVTKLSGVVVAAWVVVLWVGEISSLTFPTLYVKDTLNFLHGGCGVGVCGGVPVGVPHALSFFLARDKYIAPLNLQKASSREVKSL